jgi:hypothetical protein
MYFAFACEVGDGVGDVVHFAVPAERHELPERIGDRAMSGVHVGVDRARLHKVDRDVLRAELSEVVWLSIKTLSVARKLQPIRSQRASIEVLYWLGDSHVALFSA